MGGAIPHAATTEAMSHKLDFFILSSFLNYCERKQIRNFYEYSFYTNRNFEPAMFFFNGFIVNGWYFVLEIWVSFILLRVKDTWNLQLEGCFFSCLSPLHVYYTRISANCRALVQLLFNYLPGTPHWQVFSGYFVHSEPIETVFLSGRQGQNVTCVMVDQQVYYTVWQKHYSDSAAHDLHLILITVKKRCPFYATWYGIFNGEGYLEGHSLGLLW